MRTTLQLRKLLSDSAEKLETMITSARSENKDITKNDEYRSALDAHETLKVELRNAEALDDLKRRTPDFVPVKKRNDNPTPQARSGLGHFVKTGETRYLGGDTANGDAQLGRGTTYSNMITKALDKTVVMRQNASKTSVAGKSFTDTVGKGKVKGGWGAEGATTADNSDLSIAQREYVLHRLDCDPEVTVETIDQSDIVDLESWVMSEISIFNQEKEEAAFWNGDGIGKPKGFLHADYLKTTVTKPLDEIQLVETTLDITADDLIDLVASLKAGHRVGAKFYMGETLYKHVAKLKNADGDYILQKPVEQPFSVLLGYEIVVVDELENNTEIAFANMEKAYQIVDSKNPISIQRDTLTKRGFVLFPTYRYVGGGLRIGEAAKVIRKKAA